MAQQEVVIGIAQFLTSHFSPLSLQFSILLWGYFHTRRFLSISVLASLLRRGHRLEGIYARKLASFYPLQLGFVAGFVVGKFPTGWLAVWLECWLCRWLLPAVTICYVSGVKFHPSVGGVLGFQSVGSVKSISRVRKVPLARVDHFYMYLWR